MKSACLVVLVVWLLGSSFGWAETEYARPVKDFNVGYGTTPLTLKLYPATVLEAAQLTDDSLFATVGDDPRIFKLSRKGPDGRTLFRQKNDHWQPLELQHVEINQAWMVFLARKGYRVAEQSGDVLALDYAIGEQTVRVKLPAKYFNVMTATEIAQAQQAKRTPATKPKPAAPSTLVPAKTAHAAQSNFTGTLAERRQAKAVQELREYLLFVKPNPKKFRVTTQAEEATCIVQTADGAGSGFLAMDGDHVYLYTNIHLLPSRGKISAQLVRGARVTLGPLEIAQDRDLARFLVSNTNLPVLKLAQRATMNGAVTAYGNSSGGNVVTSESGRVLGVGPQEVEISCEVVPGNSGGPVVNAKGEVVGVVSHGKVGATNRMSQGTRYAEARRFAASVMGEIPWEVASLENFASYQQELAQSKRELEEWRALSDTMSGDWNRKLNEKYFQTAALKRWVAAHNALVDRARQGQVSDLGSAIRARGQSLATVVDARARFYRNYQLVPENRFLRDEFKEQASSIAAFKGIESRYRALDYHLPTRTAQSTYRAPTTTTTTRTTPTTTRTTTTTRTQATPEGPLDAFFSPRKSEFVKLNGEGRCLLVCQPKYGTGLLQLVFTARQGNPTIQLDAYRDGQPYPDFYALIAHDKEVSTSRSVQLKQLIAFAKAYRQDVEISSNGKHTRGFLVNADRCLLELVDYIRS
ncbi:S1 family peptidase [Cerasicoccus maritimus]|uniref:S1 family peptidase n=1 Tax=Cerasicoccus maritimus TaxID=490089 RepID=UPI002852CB16|nr:serine protease [Cerasicoccus maritimus]